VFSISWILSRANKWFDYLHDVQAAQHSKTSCLEVDVKDWSQIGKAAGYQHAYDQSFTKITTSRYS
jgi:hypothetical protein